MTNKEKMDLLKLFEKRDLVQEFIDMEKTDFIDFIFMNYYRSKNLCDSTFKVNIKNIIIIDAYVPLHDYAYFETDSDTKYDDKFIDELNEKMIFEYYDEIKCHIIEELLKYNKIARDYYMEINA